MVSADDAGRVLLEIAQTLRAFRVAGQRQGRNAISGTKVGVLNCLDQDGSRLSDIAHKLAVSVSVTSRAVESLEQEGLVERHPDQDDGRASLISLTPLGRRDLDRRLNYIAERFAGVLQESDSTDVMQTLAVLQKLNIDLGQLTEVLKIDERESLNE